MPFKSKAQQRFMFAAEARGELPKGTARTWAHHTKSIKRLPEHVHKKQALADHLDRMVAPDPFQQILPSLGNMVPSMTGPSLGVGEQNVHAPQVPLSRALTAMPVELNAYFSGQPMGLTSRALVNTLLTGKPSIEDGTEHRHDADDESEQEESDQMLKGTLSRLPHEARGYLEQLLSRL